MRTSATQRAIAKVGSKTLASELGISRQAVEQWLVVPPKHVLRVEQLSGISRYELRPDIYGSEPPVRPKRMGNGHAVAA